MVFRRCFLSISTFVLLLFTLSGCQQYKGPYTFRQDKSNIVKIEVCTFDTYHRKVIAPIVQLTDSEAEQVMTKLSNMMGYEYFPMDIPNDYGEAVICIHYLNGETEVIGLYNTGWITSDGKMKISLFTFYYDEIRELILSLVGEDDLPGLRE